MGCGKLYCVFLRQSPNQPIPIVLQPFAARSIVGQYPLHLCPEAGGVVHLQAVTQLMHHHIVPHLLGTQHQQTVEVQIGLRGTRPPAAALIADGDPAIGHAHQRGEVPHPLGDICECCVSQLTDFLMGEGNHLRLPFSFVQMLCDPRRFLLHKCLNILCRHPQGCADYDAAVGVDLNGNGLSCRANEGVFVLHLTALRWSRHGLCGAGIPAAGLRSSCGDCRRSCRGDSRTIPLHRPHGP